MWGMIYILSWDLVQWISTSPYPPLHLTGPEDEQTGRWLQHSGLVKHWIRDTEALLLEPPSHHDVWSPTYGHAWESETIAVHPLKSHESYMNATRFFMKDFV